MSTTNIIDLVNERLHLKNDAALCRMLNVTAPQVSKIRNGHTGLTPTIILRLHEIAGLPVTEIRQMIANAGVQNDE